MAQISAKVRAQDSPETARTVLDELEGTMRLYRSMTLTVLGRISLVMAGEIHRETADRLAEKGNDPVVITRIESLDHLLVTVRCSAAEVTLLKE